MIDRSGIQYETVIDDVVEAFSIDATLMIAVIERMTNLIENSIFVDEENIRVRDIPRNELNVDILNCDMATLKEVAKLLREWKRSMTIN